jgi:hypothetical protein
MDADFLQPVDRPTARHRRRSHKRFRLQALQVYPYCQWCQCPLTRQTATTDHLVPLSRGGSNGWDNLCLACRRCNQGRKNNLPDKEPSGPRWGAGPPPSLPAPVSATIWVAWTRYPGGRWRSTFRNTSPERLRKSLDKLMGTSVETVILPAGQDPAMTPENRPP